MIAIVVRTARFRRRSYVVVVSCLAFWSTNSAKAEFSASGMVGGGFGVLSRQINEPIQTSSFVGLLGFTWYNLNVHAFSQQMNLNYSFNKESYVGLYSLSGFGLGYYLNRTGGGRAALLLQAAPGATYSVLTESKSTVNDKTYKYSELIVLQGDQAAQMFLGYEFLQIGKGGDKEGENLYLGFFLGGLRQGFTSQKVTIKTNDTDMEPISPGRTSVAYSVTMVTAHLSFSYRY